MSREAKARWDEQRRSDRQARRRAHYRAGCREAAIACWQISKEFNVGSLIRSAHAAALDEVVLIDSQEWNLAAAKSSEIYTPVISVPSADDFFDRCDEKSWTPVAIETSPDAVTLFEAVYPERPCFLLGAELGGLPDEVMSRSAMVVRIPQWGLVPSLNVAVAGSIVLWDWLSKLAAAAELDRPTGGLVEPWPDQSDSGAGASVAE